MGFELARVLTNSRTDKRSPLLLATPSTPSQRCCYFAWETRLNPPQPEQPNATTQKPRHRGLVYLCLPMTIQNQKQLHQIEVGLKSGRHCLGSESGRNRVAIGSVRSIGSGIGSGSGSPKKPYSKSGRNRVEIGSKSGRKSTSGRNRVEIGSKSGRNRIEIGSKSGRDLILT